MSKNKVSYRCTNCEHTSFKWLGCCPMCNEWNSFVEHKETQAVGVFNSKNNAAKKLSLFNLSSIPDENKTRMFSGINEWDRVLGGGILPGSFLILTGDPGIGKSTLLLQVANNIAEKNSKVLYFSSEESLQQVKNRARRLNINSEKLFFSDHASLDAIFETGKQ